LIALALCALPLAACDQLGLNDGARIAAAREAEGKAIGGACRHSGRALEECYDMNAKTSKAAIFAGWRDMDGYMRENNIQIVSPDGAEEPARSGAPDTPKAAAAEEKPIAADGPAPKNVSTPVNESAAPRLNGPSGGKRPNRLV
jgi:hypothetical protein